MLRSSRPASTPIPSCLSLALATHPRPPLILRPAALRSPASIGNRQFSSSMFNHLPHPIPNLAPITTSTATKHHPLHPISAIAAAAWATTTHPSLHDSKKGFSTLRHQSTTPNGHNFDTHAFVQRLEASGISKQQADSLVAALADVIDESINNLARGLVTREEGEKNNYTQKVDFTRLKSELQLLERNDFAMMKSENERLMADVEKLKQRLREEITRTTAGVRLDLNLEKGRIRDESSVHALKIKEVDTRIESEIAGLRTSIQSAKFNVLQYLVGVATGAGALLLAYLRMFR